MRTCGAARGSGAPWVLSNARLQRRWQPCANIAAFADVTSGAVIAIPVGTVVLHRKKIITLAAQHRLPGMYPYRFFAAEGGLMSYGSDVGHQYRNAASYIDRILRGAKPKDLPVQQPTKFEFVINLQTARALGIEVPNSLQLLADEVIE